MGLESNTAFDLACASICAALILGRCVYRLACPCKRHATCHRKWRLDDTCMTLALIPLLVRSVIIALVFHYNPTQTSSPVTAADAAAEGMSIEELTHRRMLAFKLLIPMRLSYALFLWCLKFSLLAFYSRFVNPLDWGRTVIRVLYATLIVTYIGVIIATVSECRPLSLSWELIPKADRPACARGFGNLLTTAITNIVTDIALVILPFPMLRHVRVNLRQKIQLILLFGLGGIVVAISILRVPMVLISSISQSSRSFWSSVEILAACIVTNAAFYYKIARDVRGKTDHRPNFSPSRGVYLQTIPSRSACADLPERPKAVAATSSRSVEDDDPSLEGGQHHEYRVDKIMTRPL